MNHKDILALPEHILHFVNMNDANEICRYGKNNNIESCVYSFIRDYGISNEIMKYGMSADKEHLSNGQHLARPYRQAANIPGWPKGIPASACGADMERLCKRAYHGIGKNEVSLRILDTTNYPFINPDSPEQEIRNIEGFLIDQYEAICGRRPFGNIRRSIPRGIPLFNDVFTVI